MKIPISNLSPEVLLSIIEGFVLREGTDYGPGEHDLESKRQAVLRQLQAGDAEIDFDPETETLDIRLRDERG